jgi:succinate dehydrogenase / fumarate reductase flavoprotein subunit
MSNVPGLFVLGEANFSDHGANRLGASALMQGLADGYFVIPNTLADYLARVAPPAVGLDHPAFQAAETDVAARTGRLLAVGGTRTVDDFHKALGALTWERCGMSRTADGLTKMIEQVPALREEFWRNVAVPGTGAELNQSLEKAGRVADFMELAELLAIDALHREESCGGHFREEFQTPEGEARRDDDHFSYVAGWEWGGEKGSVSPVTSGSLPPPVLHKEALRFEHVHFTQRSYK